MLPIRFGTDEQFAALNMMLQDADFNDAALCARAEVPNIYEVLTSSVRQNRKPPLVDTLDALMWVLLEGRPLSIQSWNHLISDETTDVLMALGLLVEQAGEYICPIALYPIENVYVISDRNSTLADKVYPALIKETGQFLDIIPRSPCKRFLEGCAGTAVAALLAARDFAAQSYGYDIAERSVQFAEFNRRLNGLANVTNASGDLYEPAGPLTFDRIVAHPPYVPALKSEFIFRDGGDDGEYIVRRLVEGLPQYLAPGGQFAMQAMGSDRKDAPYEYRVRQWLGEAQDEFDIALISKKLIEPADFVAQSVMRGRSDSSEIGQWRDVFTSRGVLTLIYGALLITRKTESRAPFTIRRQHSPQTNRQELDWLIHWEGSVAAGSGVNAVLDRVLSAAPNIELRVVNRLQDGAWAPGDYLLQTEYPFNMDCQAQPWMAYLLSQCDGRKTGRELWKQLIAEEIVFPDTPLDQFAAALQVLVSGGFLRS